MKTGKRALVTGAAAGIGLCTARRLASDGCVLFLLDRLDGVREVAETLAEQGVLAYPIVADLTRDEDIRAACAEIDRLAGGCDILINNAGVHVKRDGHYIPDESLTVEDWEMTMRVNVTAPFLLSQYAVKSMASGNWGRIVNVSSRAGRTSGPAAGTHYSASKAALIGMTRSMAAHYGRVGITINAVAPGHVLTPMALQQAPEVLARSAQGNPLGRLGDPDEIASAIQYLTTPAAGFITGAVIDANGGGFMG
ncbi:SDR family NAD(P)-dependent oxidoreductase [Variovorax sp. J31P179]|uniref:SDR family NAD(P)-dependent oxidoreductase n=1 Tax=Variovorax sp. J31P179 TaxID=3053508 RepID=UPI002578F751|nr:SDR family NAD(P)-dependent oxidoreductase [Variovorax sp. J31P179]MDM0084733.1 SDR family NAD(P)-dependent oxidoreductase [Variovorax sp. J31P179]